VLCGNSQKAFILHNFFSDHGSCVPFIGATGDSMPVRCEVFLNSSRYLKSVSVSSEPFCNSPSDSEVYDLP